jgi:hypothetical protein
VISTNRAISENSILYVISYNHVENKYISKKDLDFFPLYSSMHAGFRHIHMKTIQKAMENESFDFIFKLLVSDSRPLSWLHVCRPDRL